MSSCESVVLLCGSVLLIQLRRTRRCHLLLESDLTTAMLRFGLQFAPRFAPRLGARGLHLSPFRKHGDLGLLIENPGIKKVIMTFREASGKQHRVLAPVGVNLLDLAHHYKVPLEDACKFCIMPVEYSFFIVETIRNEVNSTTKRIFSIVSLQYCSNVCFDKSDIANFQ